MKLYDSEEEEKRTLEAVVVVGSLLIILMVWGLAQPAGSVGPHSSSSTGSVMTPACETDSVVSGSVTSLMTTCNQESLTP